MCLNEFILATNDQLTRLKKQFSTKYRRHISTSFAYCQNLILWDARQQTPLHPTHPNGQPDDHRNLRFARASRQNVGNANWKGQPTATACTRVNIKHCLSLLLHHASCRFTKYHTTNKCTNCISFILNHFFRTLSLLLHVSIAYRLSSSGSTYSS